MRLLAILPFTVMLLCAENWPGFRGKGARGLAESSKLPTSWNVETGANIAWKTAVPGLGLSSPVIWEDLVFVTSAVSSNPDMVFESKLKGALDKRYDTSEQEFRVLAIDKATGRIVWNQLALKSKPRVLRHPHNSYASPTPATDGKRIVAFFGSEGLYCFDLKGKMLWKKDLGMIDQGAFDVPDYQWGTAASPILWDNKVFLQVDMHRDSFLVAFDAGSGKELWRTPRDSKPSWSTPTIIEGKSRPELVANGVGYIAGYDPATGKELWRLNGTSLISVPTPFEANGLIYVFTGYFRDQRRSYAIRPGATGDITASKDFLAWSRDEAPYLSTPVVSGNYVFAFGSRGSGILNVYDSMTGETVYQQRMGEGTGASASVIAAGDRVYAVNEDGDVYVIKVGDKYEEMAVNKMGEPVLATPAASGDTLFMRSTSHLFAIRNRSR